jgi:arsenical pump membrane protein
MVMTAAAGRLGVLDCVAESVFRRASLSIGRLYFLVFFLSVATASLLNNDAAILLLTPLVLGLVRQRYPGHPQLLLPFAFAVLMAPGVAPFVVSNPMNMIVASSAGLNFNAYAAQMVPISIAGWVIAFVILWGLFGSTLSAITAGPVATRPVRPNAAQSCMMALLIAVLGSYPLVAAMDPTAIWVVATLGALFAVAIACRQPDVRPVELIARGVAWEILVFLLAVFVIAIGLRNVGLVGYLSSWYQGASIARVGTIAAVGSALLNNHPMAIMNLLALEDTPGSGQREILAALIGGDLGPRLLPIGSLAGLLWLESCRRLGVQVSLRQFVVVGLAVALPTLAMSLAILALR